MVGFSERKFEVRRLYLSCESVEPEGFKSSDILRSAGLVSSFFGESSTYPAVVSIVFLRLK